MTEQELKDHFNITQCTNPEHTFWIGKKFVLIQIANDYWLYLNRKNQEEKQHLCFTKITDVDGFSYYRIIIFKLMILIG